MDFSPYSAKGIKAKGKEVELTFLDFSKVRQSCKGCPNTTPGQLSIPLSNFFKDIGLWSLKSGIALWPQAPFQGMVPWHEASKNSINNNNNKNKVWAC